MTRPFSELRERLFREHPGSRKRVAVTLAELRAEHDRTQEQVAWELATTQSGVSRIERQDDIRVSTLRKYVEATGGTLHLIASYDDHDQEIDL